MSQPREPTRVSPPRPARRRRRGFTIIETALATVIIGTGVLAIVAAQQAYHRKNMWSQRIATAMHLANELRELTLAMPPHDPITGVATLGREAGEDNYEDYDDLDDFAGAVDGAGFGAGTTFDPPINGLRQEVQGLPGFSQFIRVENVLPDNIGVSSALAQPLGATDMMRVTVTVRFQAQADDEPLTLANLTWVVGVR